MTTKGKGKGKGKGKKGKGKGDESTKGSNSNYNDNGNWQGSKGKGKDTKGTTKGKGKSKGGGKGTLQCSHCGKLGHTVDKCWWDNATTSEEQGASSSTTADAGTTQVASFDWVMSYGIDEVPDDGERLLLDSGASIHACPLHYASDIPLAEQSGATQMRTVRTVSGAHMKVYGTRTVGYLFGTIRASITYVVTDVQYPVVSVSMLLKKGYNVYLSTDESYIYRGEHSCSVYKKGHPNYLFYLCPDGRIDTSPTLAPLLTSKSTAKDFRPKHQDYWKVDGDHLVRVHKLPRKALFVPTGTTDRPIPLDRLTEQRSTTYKFLQDTTSHKHEDSWSTHAQSVLLSRHWVGETRFLLKPADSTAPAPTARFRVTGKSAPTVAAEPATAPVPMQVEADAPTAAPSQVLPPAHFAPARGAGPTGPGPPTFERPPGLPVDYWEKRGYTWIRHHVIPRTTLFVPLLVHAPGCPDPSTLESTRTTVMQTSESTSSTHRDEWDVRGEEIRGTTPRTGHTQFEEHVLMPIAPDYDMGPPAAVARGLPSPAEPTTLERATHNLTHLPYRTWCPICVRAKGKQDSSKQRDSTSSKIPVIQADYGFLRTGDSQDKATVFTAIDVSTGLCTATVVMAKGEDRYVTTELKRFLLEAGRTTAVIQTDQEPAIKAAVLPVAKELPDVGVRCAPPYHSQSQGSVERLHAVLFAQVRALREQVKVSYGIEVNVGHPMLPWIVRHAAWLLNRYLVHSDGCTSYQRRWEKSYTSPLCEFAETIQYRATGKHLHKLSAAWFQGLWLGRDTEANEVLVGTPTGVIRVRSIRRLSPSERYCQELIHTMRGLPWAPKGDGIFDPGFILQDIDPRRSTTQPTAPGDSNAPPDAGPLPERAPTTATSSSSTAVPRPTRDLADPALGSRPTKMARTVIPQGTIRPRDPTAAADDGLPPKAMRVAAIQTKDGTMVELDPNEDQEELRLQEPRLWEGLADYPEDLLRAGMQREMDAMREFEVYSEVPRKDLDPAVASKAITTRWVLRWKGDEVRARLVARGFTQEVKDPDDIYASTPLLTSLRAFVALALARGWHMTTGDVSTAFLHAAVTTSPDEEDIYIVPPVEYYPGKDVLWRLHKAMYGLRTSPRAWQEHFAIELQQMGCRRLLTDPNIYVDAVHQVYVIAYVDDIMCFGENTHRKHDQIATEACATEGYRTSSTRRES